MLENLERRLHKLEYLRENSFTRRRGHILKKYTWCGILIECCAGMIMGILFGHWLDEFFGTFPLFLFTCTILGIVVGIYNVYVTCYRKTSKHNTQ